MFHVAQFLFVAKSIALEQQIS